MEQKKRTFRKGNTSNVRKDENDVLSKTRNWCFTLNNYTKKDIDTIYDEKLKLNLKQFCFQEEKGENETPHLQGTLAYKNAISFNTMKKLLPTAHWERCKNLKKSLTYCSKAETRIGKTYTHNYTIFNEGRELTYEDVNKYVMEQHLADALEHNVLSGLNL